MPIFEAGQVELTVGGKTFGPFAYTERSESTRIDRGEWSVTLELTQSEQQRQDMLAFRRELEEDIEQHCREQCGFPRTVQRATYRHRCDANGAPVEG